MRTQRALERLYDRIGSRVILVCIAWAAFVILVMIAIALTVFAVGYLNASASEWLLIFGVGCATTFAGAAVALISYRGMFFAAASWTGGERSTENAPQVWEILVRLPILLVRRGVLAICLFDTALLLVMRSTLDLPAWGLIPASLVVIPVIATGGVLVLTGIDLILRPMIADVSNFLPPGFEPGVRSWSLRTRALAPLPIVTLFSALVVGALVEVGNLGQLERMTLAIGIAFVTVAIAGGIYAVVTRSVLHPIDDLIDATRRVRAGDLATAVPLVSADELGDLSSSFNEMLEGLQEREALRDDLRASRARIVATADAERRRMERDLHDGAQQHLVLLKMKLGMLEEAIDRDPIAAKTQTAELKEDLGRALAELRDLAHGIYPAVLEHEGLAAALRAAVEQAPISGTVESNGAGRYKPELEAAVYFCCLEALQNAAKHAGEGAAVRVSLAEQDGDLTFEVADSGKGFDPASHNGSTGLQNMADRIGALGGALAIESSPGEGTSVSGTVPVG
jgi:signal transduction histidine kinase